MSYRAGAALQAAVYTLLSADTALLALVDGIHDAAPPGAPQGTYVLLGEDEAFDRGDATGPGAEHRLTVAVVSDAPGFLAAKQAAARVSDLLADAEPAVAGARVAGLWFHDARARRLAGGQVRRIDLRFRARLEIL